MFKTLQDISVATALNSKAQIPISLPLYFGVSMPAFITLHIIEHTLPMGVPRTIVKCTKVITGIPFCLTSELVDKAGTQILEKLKLPDATLDMQGTIGVPSDVKLEDVLRDMRRWSENNAEELETVKQLYKLQRKKK